MIHGKRLLWSMSTSLGLRRVYAFLKGRVNPDSHGQWAQINFFDAEFVRVKQSDKSNLTLLRVRSIVQGHQPSTINHQPSTINHQPSTISHQPSAISHQPSAISHQPSAISR